MAETHGVVRETRVEQVVTGSRIGVGFFLGHAQFKEFKPSIFQNFHP